jgi:hypothetical protein
MTTDPTQPHTGDYAEIRARFDIVERDPIRSSFSHWFIDDVRALVAEVDRLRAENTAMAARIAAAERLARNWTGAPHEVTSEIDRHLQEDYGTTAIAHCGRAILTALGLDQDGEGQANG